MDQYINTHDHDTEPVLLHVNGGSLGPGIQDDNSRVVTVMHSQSFPTHLSRQLHSHPGEGPWSEEHLDPEARIAALAQHLAQHSRVLQLSSLPKPPPRTESHHVESSVMLDTPLRLFNANTMEDATLLSAGDAVLELTAGGAGPGASPAHTKHSKKSLPHKKRISRKLRRNHGNCTPQQDIVVINCNDEMPQEEILPDNFVAAQHHEPLPEDDHHITHVRPILICQLCGDFYGEEQMKFYQHLKQHYEPHATIIIENPVPDLGIDKMTNTCIVDNGAALPDSIVELSLENITSKSSNYQPIDKHILYTSSDKSFHYTNNKVLYSMANMDRELPLEKDMYEGLERVEFYDCNRCNKSFRKQKHRDAHIKEAHSKLDEINEFSEPEDLMEGIHVSVEEGGEGYEHSLLPHLTVENGHIHQQQHMRHSTWYSHSTRGGNSPVAAPTLSCGDDGAYCPMCPARDQPEPHSPHQLKEEVFHRIYENEMEVASMDSQPTDNPPYPPLSHDAPDLTPPPADETDKPHEYLDKPHDYPDKPHEYPDKPHEYPDKPHEYPDKPHEYPEKPHEYRDKPHEYRDKPHDYPGKPHEYSEKPYQEEKSSESGDKSQESEERTVGRRKGEKTFNCLDCARAFKHRNSLLYHVLSHQGKREHGCDDCGKRFYTAGALKVHSRLHNGDKPYKCEECGRDFRQWGDLKYHMTSLHTDKKAYKCEFCGKDFARKYSLSVHRRIHTGEKNYKCSLCDKTFRASSYRQSHMKTHTGDKPHKCPECEKGFRGAGDLKRHMLVHDKMRNRAENIKKEKEDPKVPSPPLPPIKKEIKEEIKKVVEKIKPLSQKSQAVKRIALASTTRLPVSKAVPEKKHKPKKTNKKGAPNVTVCNTRTEYRNSEYANNVEVIDTRQSGTHSKLKNLYSDAGPVTYKRDLDNDKVDREFATLKPMSRANEDEMDEKVYIVRNETTDGKLHIFTHVEKNKEFSAAVGSQMHDVRSLELREGRTDLSGEVLESGFFERFSSLFNIPAV